MSVINLSSEDEDDCIILDSDDDDEDIRNMPSKSHHVFIVESIQDCSFNEEDGPRSKDTQKFPTELQEQNMFYNNNEKLSRSHENVIAQNYNKVSLSRNKKDNCNIVNLSNIVKKQNDHSASPDKVQNRQRIVVDNNQLSNQNIEVLSETKDSDSRKDSDCSTSQKNLFFSALQLTSLCFKDNKCGGTCTTNCHSSPKRSPNEENKTKSTLKLLAEKLAQVLGNNESSDVYMSSLECTILEVSRGNFTYCVNSQGRKLRSPKNIKETKINRSKTNKIRRGNSLMYIKSNKYPKLSSKVEIPIKQSNLNEFVHEISENKFPCNNLLNNLEGNSNTQPPQLKTTNKTECTLKTRENIKGQRNPSSMNRSINGLSEPSLAIENKNNQRHETWPPDPDRVKLKSEKKSANHTKSYKPPSLENGGPYDNKLKFTFDRSVSVYSVSVVPASEPQLSEGCVNICRNDPQENDQYLNGKPSLPSQESVEILIEDQNTEKIYDFEVISSSSGGKLPLSFSNIPNIKYSFGKHYSTVFDDKTDGLCVEMGYLLLQTIEGSKNLQKLMGTSDYDIRPPQSCNLLYGSDELKTAIQTCQDVLHRSKRKFIDHFSQIHNQINRTHIIGTQHKIVLLTAWFMKMFLSITTKSPDLMDILHDIKTKVLDVLSEEIVRWPLICKTFIKDENQFECDCLLVLGLIKECLKDKNKLNSSQIASIEKPQTVACSTSKDKINLLLGKPQKLVETSDNNVPIIINNPTETTNFPNITFTTDYNYSQINRQNHSLVSQTELEVSNDVPLLKKYTNEQLPINDCHCNTASCKIHFQSSVPKNDNLDNPDKSASGNSGTFVQNHSCKSTFKSCSSNSDDKRKRKKNDAMKQIKYLKLNNMQHVTDKLQKPKKHEIHEEAQPKTPPLVFIEDKANKNNAIHAKYFNSENIPKTNLENELNSIMKLSSRMGSRPILTNSVQSGEPDQHGGSQGALHDMNRPTQNNVSSVSMDCQLKSHSRMYPQEMCISSLQSKFNCKQTKVPNLKEHHPNTELVDQHLQINHPKNFPCFQESGYPQNQQYVEHQSEKPPLPCTNGYQSIQCCQSCQPNLFMNNDINPSKYPQSQGCSANHIKTTAPTTTNSVQDYFFPTNSCVSNSNKQQFPVSMGNGMEISSCSSHIRTPVFSACDILSNTGVTINNYNYIL